MINHDSIRQIKDKYVRLLRGMSPDRVDIDQYAAELLINFEQELLQVTTWPGQEEVFTKYWFLCSQAEMQMGEAENLQVLSQVATHHMRVENALLAYLKSKIALRREPEELAKMVTKAEEHASLSQYLIILKDIHKQSSEFGCNLFSAMKEVDAVRKKFSRNLTYTLLEDDVKSMQKFLELEGNHTPATEPVEAYVDFCNYCYRCFTAAVSSTADVHRKIMKLPEQKPDWIDFVRRYPLQ